MADQPRKKPAGQKSRNDSRPNGKAFKSYPSATRREYRGSKTRRTPLTELQKALLGGGAMKRITKRIPGGSVG